jgi:hypothetical protein
LYPLVVPKPAVGLQKKLHDSLVTIEQDPVIADDHEIEEDLYTYVQNVTRLIRDVQI